MIYTYRFYFFFIYFQIVYIKIFKYLANFTLVGIAISETLTNYDITLSNVINVCSAILLVIQIIFEFIVHNIIKQIDYLRLSVELDIEESGIFKSILSFALKEKRMEEKAILAQGGSLHTPAEEKMIAEIKAEFRYYAELFKLTEVAEGSEFEGFLD